MKNMNNELIFAKELIDFINNSPTAFHAVLNIKQILINNGFSELKEDEKWNIKKGNKYFVVKNDSAIVAFIVGMGEIEESGFKIIGAHTDSPSFKIKPYPEMVSEGSYLKLNTEVYGGPILNTWLDRPLSLAGRVMLRGENILYPKTAFINIQKPVLIIPNLAIHMNNKVNSGVELNKQKDMLPLLSIINDEFEKDNYLINMISKEINVKPEDIIDFDLYLYEFQKGCIMGVNNEFISSSRLDDLAMVQSGISALVNSKSSDSTNVMVCFDNEEVGSSTKQGADSPMFSSILERINISLGKGREEYFRSLSKSFFISADLAHAVHPNRGEKADPINKPIINKGPVIKISANQSYTTDSFSCAIYEEICRNSNIPVQKFVNRSDKRGGSTIGPISSKHLDIPSIDIGTSVLAMHSIRELSGVLDHSYITKSFEEFYSL